MTSPRDSESLSLSEELQEVVDEAEDIAHAAGQTPGSVHLLLAFFTTKNAAERFLRERGIDEDRLLQSLEPSVLEPRGAVRAIMERAAQVAFSCGASDVDGLHVLVGITRVQESAAHVLLQRMGEKLPRLRTRALTLLTGSSRRWILRNDAESELSPRHHLSKHSMTPSRIGGDRARAVSWSPPIVSPKAPKSRRDPPPPRRRDSRSKPKPSPPRAEKEAPPQPPTVEAGGLSPDDFPWLTSLGRNLSLEAASGELDLLVGREAEVEQLVDILGKRRSNNPCLIGEPGVGKTAIVEGLASKWAKGTKKEQSKVIIALDAGRLLMGTQLRGSFSEKLKGIQEEVQRSNGQVLIFFDEIHTLVGIGSNGDGPLDAANELKAALARGSFPCIGATTPSEFSQHIAKDPALERRFVPVLVEEPTIEQAEAMIAQLLPTYAEFHGVGYTPESIQAAVRLSARFIPDKQLPDKAIALLDLGGSRVARSNEQEVTRETIADLVEERTGIPTSRLLADDQERLLKLESELATRVVGHDSSLKKIAEVVRRHAVGFSTHRPQGSFLLVGPTGVGKTETAKALAEILHGDEDNLVRFDLSEYSEAHSVSRLIGAPPGYVGHDSGGQLTAVVRQKPSCILLFDEIEKAHRDVLQVLLQILDDGRVTDGHGRTVGFSETIIVLTSNLGAEEVGTGARSIGFGGNTTRASDEERVLAVARKALPIELWGRIDEKLYYGPLARSALRRIVRLLAASSSAQLMRDRGISFELDGPALEALIDEGGLDSRLGARPLRRILSHLIEGPIAARILEGRLHAGERVRISYETNRGLVFRAGSDAQTVSQRPTTEQLNVRR